VVTTSQLHALGITRSDIDYRVAAGRLHRIHRGVYAVGHRRLTVEALFVAAVLAVGDDAALSHAAAAALWNLRPWPGSVVDVVVMRKLASRPGLRIHAARTLHATDITNAAGIPVTTPARTLLDLADVLPTRALERAVHEAEVRRIVDHRLLRDQIAGAPGRRAAARLATVIAAGPAPTRSELEDRALALLSRPDLPPPRTNAYLADIEVDFLYERERLVLETDGARYHATAFARRNDADKQARLEAAGYRVLRLTWDQVTRRPEQTLDRVHRALGG
jgi:uncharacterized protein DUF559/putative AbiEi antitoxin of type IV toxin-antitoxin system